jgi:WD40 repeat protein
VNFYESGVGAGSLTYLSALPPKPKTKQSLAHSSGPFLIHGSVLDGFVTLSDPTTGKVGRDIVQHPERWIQPNQRITSLDNMVAFGTSCTVFTVDVSNRRKLDGGVKKMEGIHSMTVTALHVLSSPIKAPVPGKLDKTFNLISGDALGEIQFHDARTGMTHEGYRHRLPGQASLPLTSMITYLDYHAISNQVVIGTCTGDLWLFDPESNSGIQRVPGTEYDVRDWETPQGILSAQDPIALEVDISSIFVVRGKSIRRYSLAKSSTTEFEAPDCETLTCVAIDPENYNQSKPRLFAVGDAKGIVYVYNTTQPPSYPVLPLYTISTVPNVQVTALAINALVIITGSNDGTAKAYSTLNGSYLRTLCTPTSRRRRHRPPTPLDPDTNPITAISLPRKLKSEVRGAIAFRVGLVRYWDFAPDGVGIVLRRKRRRHRGPSAREIRGFVDDEIARDVEEDQEERDKRLRWGKLNGGIEEEDVALQVALMMSREEEERRQEMGIDKFIDEEIVDGDVWLPGRKISFGSTSGSVSPGVRFDKLEDVAVFKKGKNVETRQFDEDIDFAIRLSLAEQVSRETTPALQDS